TQQELVRAIQESNKESNQPKPGSRKNGATISQSYLSQIESGARPHLTNTTRLLLAKLFKVHPGYLVDDPERYNAQLMADIHTVDLICFGIGLVVSVVPDLGGFAHLHLDHVHVGHSTRAHHGTGEHDSASRGLSAVDVFTVTAFLCSFGDGDYLLHLYSISLAP